MKQLLRHRFAQFFLLAALACPSLVHSAATVPDPPTALLAVKNSSISAVVTFSPPASDGGSPISSYRVSAWLFLRSAPDATTTGTGSPITVTGLDSIRIYKYYVVAINAVGASQPSNDILISGVPRLDSTCNWVARENGQATVTANAPQQTTGFYFNCGRPYEDNNSSILSWTLSANGQTITSPTLPIIVKNLVNGTSYTMSLVATNSIGTSSPIAFSVVPDTIPDAPTIANVISGNSQATVSFGAPQNNGGAAITKYTVTANPGGITASGATSPITINGLTNGTTYTFTVSATNAAGSGSSSGALSVIPSPPISLSSGWNLVGNSYNSSFDVASALGDNSKVITVWKWVRDSSNPSNDSRWAFFTPNNGSTITDNGAAFAASKGYVWLSKINANEGFWVNAKIPFAFSVTGGSAVLASDLAIIPTGWNLISIGEQKTPGAFNLALSVTPPTAGSIPSNITSLWAWDNTQAAWYFFAPSLDVNGGLVTYITSKGYLDFTTTNKPLGPGVGFWVNKP